MVESDNQQQIYIWFRTNLISTLVQGQTYKEWEIHQAHERRILEKSSYFEIIVKFGVPKPTLTYFLKAISPLLKSSSLVHLTGLMGVGKTKNRIVVEVIENIVYTKKGETKLTFSRTNKYTLLQHHK